MIQSIEYHTSLPAGAHWSIILRRGTVLRMTDTAGDSNLGMLFFNSENFMERYNAPDTLKCQKTFKIHSGHCLYSDMGRIFASVFQDSLNWHDTVCGNSHAKDITDLLGKRDYAKHRNSWYQNGTDAFLTEFAKYGLDKSDLVSNLNWFSSVYTDDFGKVRLKRGENQAGCQVTLRMEMNTLVVMHACPHPMNPVKQYPKSSVQIEIGLASPMTESDHCLNSSDENRRGFANNKLYFLGRDSN